MDLTRRAVLKQAAAVGAASFLGGHAYAQGEGGNGDEADGAADPAGGRDASTELAERESGAMAGRGSEGWRAVGPRNAFLPPEYLVHRLASNDEAGWARQPAVPIVTHRHGEVVPALQPTLQLGWDAGAFYVNATVDEAEPVTRPDEPPDGRRFWEQDMVELRFIRADEAAGGSTPIEQFIFAPSGRFFDSMGLWKQGGAVEYAGRIGGGRWSIRAAIPWSKLPMARPEVGGRWRGMVSVVRWSAGYAQLLCASATELEFGQVDRYGSWVFVDDAAAPRLASLRFAEAGGLKRGENRATVRVWHVGEAPVRGRFIVEAQPGLDQPGHTATRAVELKPGDNALSATLALDRPRFTRYRFRFEAEGIDRLLGSVSLRADVPLVSDGADEQPRAHPRLLFDGPMLEAMAAKAGSADPACRHWADRLQGVRGAIGDPPAMPDADAGPDAGRTRRLVGQAAGQLERWVMTGDKSAIAYATACIKAADRVLDLPARTSLHLGGISARLGLAYDAFAPHIPEADRGPWRRVLGGYLKVYLASARHRHWDCKTIANANAVCNGGGGMIALALLGEHPEAAEGVYWARKWSRQYIDYCFGDDGGCTEGVQYLNYGGTNFFRFTAALENAIGTDDGLMAHPHFRPWINNLRLSLTNDGKLHGVNDTIPTPHLIEIACFFAGRFGDALAHWWPAKAIDVRKGMIERGVQAPYEGNPLFCLAFYPNRPRPDEQPPLPTAIHLRDIEYATARSSADYDGVFTVGLKGARPPYTHHAQRDTGSCYVHLRGERLLIDPGYYRPRPEHHCLPVINGAGPAQHNRDGGYDGRITACEVRDDLRLLVADSTPAYRGAADRVVRHMLIVGEEAVVMLDEIIAATDRGEPAKVAAWYQCGGATRRLDGDAWSIAGAAAKLRVDLLGPGVNKLELKGERSLKDIGWGYKFAECRWFPVVAEYGADAMQPLITVFTDATAKMPGAATIAADRTSRTITLGSGRSLRFAHVGGAWRFDRAG